MLKYYYSMNSMQKLIIYHKYNKKRRIKMEIQLCSCGSPMSFYEQEKFSKCGACYNEEKKAERQKQIEEEKRKQEEKVQQEKLERERKQNEQRAPIREKLKKIIGKTVESVFVNEWTDALGEEAKSVMLRFTDGSTIDFTQEKHADGCMGHYDYYHYLEIEYDENK
jgi:vacuolar-type H+-ATPase subunit I/STV1